MKAVISSSIRRWAVGFLFTKDEKIYIQQGLMSRIDKLREDKISKTYWEAQDNEQDIDRIFSIKDIFKINSKKHYEGYY